MIITYPFGNVKHYPISLASLDGMVAELSKDSPDLNTKFYHGPFNEAIETTLKECLIAILNHTFSKHQDALLEHQRGKV